jgi:N-acylneuraminate cytidylyltransferase
MKSLFVIPARGGSKGIPRKNIKLLGGKPLIHYSIEFARLFVSDNDICLTSDDPDIIACAAEIGYKVPFIRPQSLSTDYSGTFEVVKHAVKFFKDINISYDIVILLQPTSPFRLKLHLDEALKLYSSDIDMVVSVSQSPENPYFNLFELNGDGYLKISKGNGSYARRQDAPTVYNYNGSLYIINVKSLERSLAFKDFLKVRPYEMDNRYSLDLDEQIDWMFAEFLISSNI